MTSRATTIGGASTIAAEVAALTVNAASFDLTIEQARGILTEVAAAVAEWKSVARRNGVAESEIADFAPALDKSIKVVGDAAV